MQNTKEALPSALVHFSSLPNEGVVRLPVVCGLFGVSPATAWRMTKDGRLPPALKLGPKITTWNVGALRDCLQGK